MKDLSCKVIEGGDDAHCSRAIALRYRRGAIDGASTQATVVALAQSPIGYRNLLRLARRYGISIVCNDQLLDEAFSNDAPVSDQRGMRSPNRSSTLRWR